MAETAIKDTLLDRAIKTISPAWGAKRDLAKAQSLNIQAAVPYQRAYQSRLDNSWSLSLSMTGIREINRFNLRRMRDRARQLERENVLAAAILDRCCDNCIGPGLRLLPTTPDDGFNKELFGLWEDWKDTAEITGRFSFGKLQWMLFRSHLRDGDTGVVLANRGEDAYLQALSGDYIDSIDSAILDNVTHVHGMELGPDQKPVQYHVKTADGDKGWWKEVIVPARNMVFYPRTKQLTDYRGEPLFTTIFTLLEQLDQYKEAEVIKKRIEACQGLIVKRIAGLQGFQALPNTTNANGDQQAKINFEPGMTHYLQPGEDTSPFMPSASEQNFPAFMRCLQSFLGLNCGLTANALLLDYTGISFTAGKAGNLQSQRHFRIQQDWFIDRVLRRVYQWRIAKWVKAGILTVPRQLRGNYWQHIWIPPAFPLLDPNKEIAAQMAEIDSGLSTWSDIALSRGHNFEELCARRKRDEAMLREAGITPARSTLTRDAVVSIPGQPSVPAKTEPTSDDDDAAEEN